MTKRQSSSNDKLIKTLEEEAETFESLYLGEKTKANRLIVVCAILAFSLLLVLVTSPFANEEGSTVTTTQQSPFTGGGSLGGGPSLDIQDLFSNDGSVDTDQLAVFKRIPAQFRSQLLSRIDNRIEDALRDDEITETQADALYDALNDL